MSIEAGGGGGDKDPRKKKEQEEEVVQLRVSDQEERFRISTGCLKQKMGEGHSEAGAAGFLACTNLFHPGQIERGGGELKDTS